MGTELGEVRETCHFSLTFTPNSSFIPTPTLTNFAGELTTKDAPPTIIPLPSAANPDLASPPSAGTSAYPPELDRTSQHGSIDPEQDLVVVAGKGYATGTASLADSSAVPDIPS